MQPPRPWPNPPPPNHPEFYPAGLLTAYEPARGGHDRFFCHGLAPKSPQVRIMSAAVRGDAADLRAALAQHADITPDFMNGNGVTPLMVAAARGHVEVLNILADHPLTNLSQQNRSGWSALHYAAYFGEAQAVTTLLRRQADIGIRNAAGEDAFSLAKDDKTAEAFWSFKPFVRYLKKQNPAHPRLSPPQAVPTQKAETPPAAPPPAQETPRAIEPLSAVFLRAALNVGLSTAAAEGVWREMQKNIQTHNNAPLFEAYDRIEHAAQAADKRGTAIRFDWDGLLATAAVAGNIPALVFIAQKRDYMDSKPLTNALAAVIRTQADTPQTAEAVRWLLRWGADANANAKILKTGQTSGTLAYQAFARKLPHVFDAICTQAGELKSWHVTPEQLKWEQEIDKIYSDYPPEPPRDADARRRIKALSESIAVLKIRSALHHAGHEKLTRHLADALGDGDLRRVCAVYTEARTDRLLRGAFNVPKPLGAAAMLLALEHGKLGFAKNLAADGHSLLHLDSSAAARLAQLSEKTDAPLQDFLRAQKSGARCAPDLLSVDDKYKMLRGQAARYPVSGRGFGF